MFGLKIIKASAGSGKTHTLTKEYMDLLFKKERAHRHILAVTFTNKATEEMKRRVVETLFQMSKTNPEALKRLNEILHDYSSFYISTIDRFFQQTMRAFAREIGKNSAYKVELDEDLVISEAIDTLVSQLDRKENQDLLNWLISYSSDTIEEGGAWNFKSKLLSMGSQIFKESYKRNREEGVDSTLTKERLKEIISHTQRVKKEFEERLKRISKDALECMDRHNLAPEDFTGGSKSGMRFFRSAALSVPDKLPNSFLPFLEGYENLAAESTKKKNPAQFNSLINCFNDGLEELIHEVFSLYQNEIIWYKSAVVISENIHIAALLTDIEKFVWEYTQKNNVVLIPETTDLLNKIIDGSDAPFIYEKCGTRIDNFMLDEFQDTSTLQWQNFKPLILESIARGERNLIVGDVKQSIYRWRGSDWSLLNNGIYSQIPKEQVEESELTFNWRSSSAIVEFNNRFFPILDNRCREFLNSGDLNVYDSVEQTLPESKSPQTGFTRVEFIENERGGENWKEVAMDRACSFIESRLENGYSQRDISLLVRTNLEGRVLVEYLLNRGYKVISDEALLISSSPVIKRVISSLRFIINPNDGINNTIATFLNSDTSYADSLDASSLFELCELILKGMNRVFSESESLFINSFLDLVIEWAKGESAHTAAFLKWWDESGYKKSVPAPTGQDALKVMTIHKAKGLGIPIVILPFFDLTLDHSNHSVPILWCKAHDKPYNSIGSIPVKYSQSLVGTIFEKDYREERIKAFIDNMNLAYVSMTRAESQMAIYAPLPPKSSTSLSVSKVLYEVLLPDLQDNIHQTGEERLLGQVRDEESAEDVLGVPIYSPYISPERLKLSLRGEDYYSEYGSRRRGLTMHRIMEFIEVESDLNRALEIVASEGLLKPDMRDEVEKTILSMFSKVRGMGWFSGIYRVYRELEIIEPGGEMRRPDRVLMGAEATVIDFKFGKKRESSHIYQVREYISLIKRSGVAYVKGYVWYPEEDELISVQ